MRLAVTCAAIAVISISTFAGAAPPGTGCSQTADVSWCAGDWHTGWGECRTGGMGVESDRTGATASVGDASAWAYGHDSCFHLGTTETHFSGVRAGVAIGEDVHVGFGWASGPYTVAGEPAWQCSMAVGVAAAGQYVGHLEPCPAGPPNPGWGHLLP